MNILSKLTRYTLKCILFEIIDERVTEFRDIPQREERQKKDTKEKKEEEGEKMKF